MSASKLSKLPNGWVVETWWDRHSQNYITQLLDAVKTQIGDAMINGNQSSARCAHAQMLETARALRSVPECVRFGQFGCVNCLWHCIECKGGSKYVVSDRHSGTSCENYCWND